MGRPYGQGVRSPADVTVEPAESEVARDAKGAAVVPVYVTPDKAAPAGPRTLAITATGSGAASTTLNVDVTVR